MNTEHRTSNLPGARETPFGVQHSMLDVRCSSSPQTWLLLNSDACPAAFNMALDEALLETVSRLGKPVLRFYGWTEPAATFGYFQKYADVERATPLRPLIRRPTGGGIVPHDADWTYSLAFPPGHEWHSLRAEESYRRVHEWIQSAFAKLKVATALAPTPNSELLAAPKRCEGGRTPNSEMGQCFASYEKFDLLWQGRKIAGAAQRRNKLGLLIQGSVQPPLVPLARADWESAMRAVAERQFGIRWQEQTVNGELLAAADRLAREKFSRDSYNRKR